MILKRDKGGPMEPTASGRTLMSYCPKCKVNTNHFITVMSSDSILKVRCDVCANSHKFKEPVLTTKLRKTRTKKTDRTEAATAIIWETSLAKARGKERDYSIAARYRIGDIVNHHIFGKGIVLRTYPNKCEMLFRDKERLMASANEYRRV